MTVIYFLYLFAFMEMLPPRDLGSVVLKSHEMEPTGPLHPPPTTLTSLHPSLMGLGVCNAVIETTFLPFPCLGTEIPHQISWDPPKKDFLGVKQRGHYWGRDMGDFSVQFPVENLKRGDRG